MGLSWGVEEALSERLELLRPVLSRFKRRFSVLDLGSGINHPTLGWEIAQEFDAVVVEVEKDWAPVEPVGKQPIVLKHPFSAADLERLGECCHFDVVIAFNILHWFEGGWQQAAAAVLGMGDYVFVQVPTEADSPEAPGYAYREALHGYCKEQGEWLGSTSQFPGHPPRPIYLHMNKAKRLTRNNWDAHDDSANIWVFSSFDDIHGTFQHKQPPHTRPWIPGINLWNFCRLGGVLPAKQQVLGMLAALKLPEKQHGDVQPWNMILDGERLHLIDEAPGNVCPSFASDAEQLKDATRRVQECLAST